eukprot:6485645-Prymnesium_polylepis.1
MLRGLLSLVAVAVQLQPLAAIQYRATSTVAALQSDEPSGCPGWCNNFQTWQTQCKVAWWASACTPCIATWAGCVPSPPPTPPKAPPLPPFAPVADLLVHSDVPGLVSLAFQPASQCPDAMHLTSANHPFSGTGAIDDVLVPD